MFSIDDDVKMEEGTSRFETPLLLIFEGKTYPEFT